MPRLRISAVSSIYRLPDAECRAVYHFIVIQHNKATNNVETASIPGLRALFQKLVEKRSDDAEIIPTVRINT
jgi:hypothetical protein